MGQFPIRNEGGDAAVTSHFTFRPSSPLTWLVATWIATVDVNAEITGADTKFRRKPGKKEGKRFESGSLKKWSGGQNSERSPERTKAAIVVSPITAPHATPDKFEANYNPLDVRPSRPPSARSGANGRGQRPD